MTARFSYANMDPQKLPVKLYEGYVTRADAFGPDGLLVEDAISYSAEVQKGDLVVFYSDSTSSIGGEVIMEVASLGSNDADNAMGIVIDTPFGADPDTVSTYTPTHALRRSATVRLFGTQIEEFTATNAAIRANYSVQFTESGSEAKVEEDASAAVKGTGVAMAYTAANGICPVLLGFAGNLAAD